MRCLAVWFVTGVLAAEGQDAASLLRAGQFDQALAVVDRDLKLRPHDSRLLALRGIALSGLHDNAAALKAYRAALAVSPDYLPALEGAAQIEYQNHDVAALAHLNRIIALRPQDPVSHAMRAEIHVRAGDCALALPDFEVALPAVRQQPEAFRHYGMCLARTRRIAEAQQVFASLFSADPHDTRAAYALAALQIQSKNFAEALNTLTPLPAVPETQELKAEAYEGLGKTPEAIQTLRDAIVAAPDHEDLYARFGELCFTYKSYQAGIEVLNTGLARLPNSAPLHVARGVLQVQQGNYSAADEDFAAAERLNPREPSSADAAVLSLLQANRLDEAERQVTAKLKEHPNDAQLSYFLAEILERRGVRPGSASFERCLAAARHAVKLRPDFVLAHDLLAKLYQSSGNDVLAIRESNAALDHDPDDETALYRLLRIMKSRHQPGDESAIAELSKRWLKARDKRRAAEQRESQFRITTGQSTEK